MKYLLVSLGAALLALCAPVQSPAELLCYQARSKSVTAGSGFTSRSGEQIFIVIDRDTAAYGQITFAEIDGIKRYSPRATTTNHYHIDVIPGGNRITNSAIAFLRCECDTNVPYNTELVLASGINVPLLVNTNTTLSFPRVMSGSFKTVDHSGGVPHLTTLTRTFVYDKTRTIAANSQGATLDETLDSFENFLISRGFSTGP
jgi:hypothetical protein